MRSLNLTAAGAIAGGMQYLLQADRQLAGGSRYAETVGHWAFLIVCWVAAFSFFWLLFGVGEMHRRYELEKKLRDDTALPFSEQQEALRKDQRVEALKQHLDLAVIAVLISATCWCLLSRADWSPAVPYVTVLLVIAVFVRLAQWNGIEPDGLAIYDETVVPTQGKLALAA